MALSFLFPTGVSISLLLCYFNLFDIWVVHFGRMGTVLFFFLGIDSWVNMRALYIRGPVLDKRLVLNVQRGSLFAILNRHGDW